MYSTKLNLNYKANEIYVTVTYRWYEVIHGDQLTHYLKDDANPSDTVGEKGKNHWTIKCMSQWGMNSIRSLTVSDRNIIMSVIHNYKKQVPSKKDTDQ